MARRGDTTVTSGVPQNKETMQHVMQDATLSSRVPQDLGPQKKPVFDCGEQNVRYKSWAALHWALHQLEIDVRFNLRTDLLELDVSSNTKLNWRVPVYPLGWHTPSDRLHAWIRDEIRQNFDFRLKRAAPLYWATDKEYYNVVEALAAQPQFAVDPLRQYCEAMDWDKTPRLDTIMARLFGCEQSNKSEWFGRYMFMGVCQRTIEPGHKLDGVPILAGDQGLGKSSFIERILPGDLRESLHANVSLTNKDGELLQAMRGRAICEVGELAGVYGRELEDLKQFLAVAKDTFRRPYGRAPHDIKRTWIMLATADRRDHIIPADPSGNRRWPFLWLPGNGLSMGSRMQLLDRERDQLFAEAWYRVYVNREPVYWSDSLQHQYSEEHKYHERSDEVLENKIEEIGENGRPLAWWAEFTNLTEHGVPATRPQTRRLVQALQTCGYMSERVRQSDGKRKRVWVKRDTTGTAGSVRTAPIEKNSTVKDGLRDCFIKKAGVRAVRAVPAVPGGSEPNSASVRCRTCDRTGAVSAGQAPCMEGMEVRTPGCNWEKIREVRN